MSHRLDYQYLVVCQVLLRFHLDRQVAAAAFQMRHMARHQTPVEIRITEADRRAAARILAMVTERQARDRLVCIEIGRAIYDHLEKKNLPHGATKHYARAVWERDWDRLQRYQKLYVQAPRLAEADEVAARYPDVDPYRGYDYEPDRSLNLLTWAAKTLAAESSVNENSRKRITADNAFETDDWRSVLIGQCQVKLCGLPDRYYQAGITSIPYHGLREYGDLEGEIGREPTVEQWAARLTQDVFREFKRVLRDDGILFIVCGDRMARGKTKAEPPNDWQTHGRPATEGDHLKPGNRMDLPGRLARAMQNNGWVWRSEIIWEKTGLTSHGDKAPQPTHERILMFTKSMRYDFHQDAVQEHTDYGSTRPGMKGRRSGGQRIAKMLKDLGSVWRIPQHTQPHGGVAPFPLELVRRLMLYATEEGERVLDPFMGTGTTGVVAKMLHRRFTGIELNPEYADYALQRIAATPEYPPASWQPGIATSEVDLLKEQLAHVTQQRNALYEVVQPLAEFADAWIAEIPFLWSTKHTVAHWGGDAAD